MIVEVRYRSRGGNTKKVAEAIASAAGAKAEDCSVPLAGPADLLFLGGSVYGFEQDGATKDFIAKLDPGGVKAVALFGTSAIVKTGNGQMKKLLEARGINVLELDFYCRGSFTVMHKGRPNADDLRKATEFAKNAVNAARQQPA